MSDENADISELQRQQRQLIHLAKLASDFMSDDNELYIYYRNSLLELRQQSLEELAKVDAADTAKVVKLQERANLAFMPLAIFENLVKEGEQAIHALNQSNEKPYKD